MLSSKSKSRGEAQRHPLSVCADCNASNPTWASINRGILICSQCCSIHRSLGRHISHVKSLKGSAWIPEQLTMVQSLYSCGANSIWEYSLLNPVKGAKHNPRKPNPTDPVHPAKSDFIHAKHQNLSFVYKPSAKDEPVVSESELSRQLHSSVRTPNLETSLRLISQGADPNYFHPEKNSTPLQVASRAGQAGQVELLLVYGADPGAVDKMGRSASDYAKQSGNSGLAHRIINSQYELSDRLSFYLCQRKPDHLNGEHFVIPKDGAKNEDGKLAKRRLQGLDNSVFEELSMDVYDEVDRRETDTVWAETERGMGPKSVIVPFLPVNPEYGTTRNQARQKLARLNVHEFAALVIDVLKEVRRRQSEMGTPLREIGSGTMRGAVKTTQTKSLPLVRRLSDDEPIYDHVASDDDYYQVPALARQSESSATLSSPGKSSSMSATTPSSSSELQQMKAQLENSEQKVQQLIDSNDDMKSEIAKLTSTVNKLITENRVLRDSVSPTHSAVYDNGDPREPRTGSRGPVSLPGPGANYMTLPSRYGTPARYPQPLYATAEGFGTYDYDGSGSTSLPYAVGHEYADPRCFPGSPDLPSQEEVVRRTEAITRCIQELLISAKDEKFDAFIPCSERIVRAVTDMVVLFPEEMPTGGVSGALSALTAAATHFETECRILIVRSQNEGPLNQSFVTQQVIQCAFDIAKATKQLVALFQ